MTTGLAETAVECIPRRFRREVALHMFRNLEPQPDRAVPLILGIHGPSGEGKTFQCTRVLNDLGCHVSFVSGGELESPNAGDPARLIRSRYVDAALRRGSTGCGLVVIIFNDIDVAIGDWGDQVRYTVNRQGVFGELMHLADYPTVVENRRVPRVPIILTGNDFTRMYGPAIRAGRMRSFVWVPTPGEKTEMLTGIFPELSEQECRMLAERFAGQPVAFFSQIRNQLTDDALWEYLESNGVRDSFYGIAIGEKPAIPCSVTLDSVTAVGQEVLKAGKLANYLQER